MKLVIRFKEKKFEIQQRGGAAMKPAKTEPEPKSGNTCRECGKSFPTEKSLCGHMRSHPERSYRGINPPKSATVSVKKSKRRTVSNSGRRNESGITMERPADGPRYGTSESLMSLYQRPLNPGVGVGLSTSKMARQLEDDDQDEEEYYDGDGYDYVDIYRRNLIRLGVKKEVEEIVENSEVRDGEEKSKKRKLRELESQVVTTGKRFECETCGKSFSSPQALGGHKTAHRKMKPSSSSSPAGQVKEEEATQAKPHFCKVCSKGFPSGQALGGHQRLHYPGSAAITTNATAVVATDTSVAQSSPAGSPEGEGEGTRQLLHLDIGLNKLPAFQEVDVSLSLTLGRS